MDQQPDYSKYAEPELLQIRKHIDAARYPERVAEIEARLAALAASPREIPRADEYLPAPITLASRWRRAVAFLIDSALLGIVGLIAGACLYDQLATLGPWGPVVGFVIFTAYFGVSQSQIGDGQTLGMKVLDLRVIAASGAPLSVDASLVRTVIFCAAYFFNGMMAYFTSLTGWLVPGIFMLLYSVSFCSAYLLIFNRRTRQSLHDLAVGAFVVNAARGPLALPKERVWRGHAAIAASAVMAICVAGVLLAQKTVSPTYVALEQVRQAVTELPGVTAVAVSLAYAQPNGEGSFNRLMVNATVDASTKERDALARRIAKIALANYAGADRMQSVAVTLSSGYDIGIAQAWRSLNYSHSPQEWRMARLP